ncbi:hypothetical protein DV532_26235 (plasmid) [Pseudomonas sp. Leaf58]|uniref:hypothetical protein n=1 Tax=Pseudomonas sp. Leaf58 TaxID=1736226 RepID=UPI000700DB04|nr:hypothetical protein [Pseudomonas sp. Leaf58]AYG47787.1 hypothetical protein DV532_26235 [Pseudomonas sp. Leaf58]KQN62648.1 hypothetical protein ASF02_10905 [Pseudomonas sp. Leaf58]
MTKSAKMFEWWLWEDNADTALEPVGGTLTVEQTAKMLGMSNLEVRVRIEERSILSIMIADLNSESILIPAFQFVGAAHVPHFHDLWDRLDPGCRVERICQFFAHETFADTGMRIIDVLRNRPSADVLQEIVLQADAFKDWCTQSEVDHRKTFCITSDPSLLAIKNNTVAYPGEQLVEASPQTQQATGRLRAVLGKLMGPNARKVGALVKDLVLMPLEWFWVVLLLAVGGLVFPVLLTKWWKHRSWLVLTDILVFMFIGSGVVFALYVAMIMGWCVGWL